MKHLHYSFLTFIILAGFVVGSFALPVKADDRTTSPIDSSGGTTVSPIAPPVVKPATPPASQTTQTQTVTLQNPLKVNSVGELIQNFVDIFTYLVILFAVLMLIWVGLQYVLARGNAQKMTENSQRLLYIVIGIAIVIGARLMVQIVINTLKATGTVNTSVLNNANNAAQGR